MKYESEGPIEAPRSMKLVAENEEDATFLGVMLSHAVAGGTLAQLFNDDILTPPRPRRRRSTRRAGPQADPAPSET